MWISRQYRRFAKNGTRILYIILAGSLFIWTVSVVITRTPIIYRLASLPIDLPMSSEAPLIDTEQRWAASDQLREQSAALSQASVGRRRPAAAERPSNKVAVDKSQSTKSHFIDGVKYPMLTADGNFVPIRRWVHIDMKGAPYKVSYYKEIFPLLKKFNINGILFEWEDMFPYNGALAAAVNGNAYNMKEVEEILSGAKAHGFDVVPLVQTFGHLEWILKLKAFQHLRDDPKFPQVLCVGRDEAWRLIVDMIQQVGRVHQKFSRMRFFHIGADEVFNMGVCDDNTAQVRRNGGRERVTLWHIARTAAAVRNEFNVTVLAWHDMMENATPQDLINFDVVNLVEPVLWSYAEDLDQYLPYSTWMALRPFKKVWAASVYKGADGPMRYSSNPMHYIRNQESWTMQMNRVKDEFDYIQGMIFSGWSRYDHMSVLCETFPVAIPALAMCLETILKGRPMDGRYERAYEQLGCQLPHEPGYVYGCTFPGHRVYELVNELYAQHIQLEKYRFSDYQLNGWLSDVAEKYTFSSGMYIDKILPFIEGYLQPLEVLERDLRTEMSRIFFDDAVDEFIETYVNGNLKFLRSRHAAALAVLKKRTFERRPFVEHPAEDWDSDRSVSVKGPGVGKG